MLSPSPEARSRVLRPSPMPRSTSSSRSVKPRERVVGRRDRSARVALQQAAGHRLAQVDLVAEHLAHRLEDLAHRGGLHHVATGARRQHALGVQRLRVQWRRPGPGAGGAARGRVARTRDRRGRPGRDRSRAGRADPPSGPGRSRRRSRSGPSPASPARWPGSRAVLPVAPDGRRPAQYEARKGPLLRSLEPTMGHRVPCGNGQQCTGVHPARAGDGRGPAGSDARTYSPGRRTPRRKSAIV